MQGSVRGRQESSRKGPVETDNSVAIGEVAEDGEIDSVDAGEDERDAHHRTHPVTPALTEGENEGAGREDEASDEGRVQSSLRTASRDMFSVESLLVEVGAEANEGSNATSQDREVQSYERGGRRKEWNAHDRIERQADLALVETVLFRSPRSVSVRYTSQRSMLTTSAKMSGSASGERKLAVQYSLHLAAQSQGLTRTD